MRISLRFLTLLFMPVLSLASDLPAGVADNACVAGEARTDVAMSDLTLTAAVHASLQHHPSLSIAACETLASDGRLVQASLRPNPEASVAVENFAGSGSREGFDAAETTLQLSQVIELGGKRAKRMALASTERDLAGWDRESQRLTVITNTRLAFIEVLAAQARLTLANELLTLSNSVLRGVGGKVKAGKVSPIEEGRTLVDVSRAELLVITAGNRLEAARQRLALNWGESGAQFDRAIGALDTIPPSPTLEQILLQLQRNPELARWPTELKRRENALQLASAMGVSNLALSGGVRQFADNDDVGVVIGFSIALPLFNRNQGAILAAQADMVAADAGLATRRLSLVSEVHAQYQALQTAHAEEESLRTRVLPLAQRVFEATSEGYRQGKFGLMEVLDAQRTLFESRGVQVEAHASHLRAAAQIEGLTGAALDSVEVAAPTAKGRTP